MILQGHCNKISCAAVSNDKRWIVTADKGPESLIVVWDSMSGSPVKSILSPHPLGITSVDISNDALFLVTLSEIDQVCVYKYILNFINYILIQIYRTINKKLQFGRGPTKVQNHY